MRRVLIGYGDQSAQLREIRAADPDGQGRHSFTAQQQTLRRLGVTFGAFFKRVRAGQQAGYPRFKPYQRFNQVLFVAGGRRQVGACHRWPLGVRELPGGWTAQGQPAPGRHRPGQDRAAQTGVPPLVCDRGRRGGLPALPETGRAVGVDVGVVRFLTTSDGEVVPNPRFFEQARARIAGLERRKAMAKPGSGNRRRLRRRLAREWRKVRNQRRDFHHKTARALVNTCDVLELEDLRVANMTKSAKGTVEDPGRNVRAKAGLNRLILDAGWGQFTIILTAKAASAGRRIVLVNPAWTSIDCHACGASCTRPVQDTVICPVCGAMDADLNGARNIATRAGLGSGQALVA
jgi:putative transposase